MERIFDALKKYWPIFLVALLLGFFGYRFWPEGKPPADGRAPGALPDQPPRNAKAPKDPEPTESTQGEREENRSKKSWPVGDAPQYRIIEKVIAIPKQDQSTQPGRNVNQDSPEVKQALSRLDIEVYGLSDSDQLDEIKEYLSHNQLSYSFHDTNDPMEHERARRAAHDPAALPGEAILVVDGQVVRGYSVDTLEQAIVQATKNRVSE